MEDKLRALSRGSPDSPRKTINSNKRKNLRILLFKALPWALGAVALLLLYLLFGERLLPATHVEVETVVTVPVVGEGFASDHGSAGSPTGTDPYSGDVLFQASGWFEADPFPYRVTALATGVVESVHALEGQYVEAGEPIATMIREDADISAGAAEAALGAARASLATARSDLELAGARIETMKRQISVAESRRRELLDLAERARELGNEVLSEEYIIQTGLRLETQDETVSALRAELAEREIEMKKLSAQVNLRESLLAEASSKNDEAQLALRRMVVRSPVSGVIQRLMVAPGQKKVLMADNPESATVALLFQPKEMQARIDVPLSEAARMRIGQAVLLETEFLPDGVLKGHVQRIVGEADLQRNTLQAKVRVVDPPAGLRPEILCRARFLDASVMNSPSGTVSSNEDGRSSSAGGVSVFVPRSALTRLDGTSAIVWVVNQEGRRAERRELSLTGETRDEYLAVREGLNPGDRVIIRPSENLKDGKRIQF